MPHTETGADTAHENLDDQADPAVGAEPVKTDIDPRNGITDAGAAGDIDLQNRRAGDADPGEAG